MPGFNNDVGYASLLTLDGSGAGAQNVIDITPDTAIGAVAWNGIFIDGSALDPTGAANVYGINIDLSGTSIVNDPELIGIDIEMPAVFSGDLEKAAGYFRGFGYEVELCSGDHEGSIVLRGPGFMDYDATALVAGESLSGFQFNVDETGSTGGEAHMINVSTTGDGTAEIVAIGTNPEVGVIHQHVGVFAATDQSWKENGGFTDVTAAFDNPAVDVTIFDNDDDYIYIGSNATFSQIRAILATVATRNIFAIFEYSIGGPAWTVFTPTDGTTGFTQSGIIEWDSADLAGWASVVVNGANHFYIRIQRTRNNIGTIPIEDTIRILEPTLYYWNEDGDILAASVTAAGLADTSGTQYEILTFGAAGILNGIGPLTDGQLIIGDTGATAVAATLASAGATITITNGPGTINLEAAGGMENLGPVGDALITLAVPQLRYTDIVTTSADAVSTADRIFAHCITTNGEVTATDLGVYIVTSQVAAQFRFGLYTDNDGLPGTRFFESGILDASGVGYEWAGSGVTVPHGVIWILYNTDVANIALRRNGGSGNLIGMSPATGTPGYDVIFDATAFGELPANYSLGGGESVSSLKPPIIFYQLT